MNTFIEFIKNNMSIIAGFLLTIVTSFSTYLYTSKSYKDKRSFDIRQKQLELVYYPLFMLISQCNIKTNNKNIPLFIKKASKIIYSNQLYVTPRTMKNFNDALPYILSGDLEIFYSHRFLSEIELRYDRLKKSLGYPYGSVLSFNEDLSPRMRTIITIVTAVPLIIIIISLVSIMLYIIKN
jgi:hypothetical protein